MRKVVFAGLAVAVILACSTSGAFAGAPGRNAYDRCQGWSAREHRIENRIMNQQARIDQGAASGRLTRPERLALQRNLNEIRRAEQRLSADGRLDRFERERLHAWLDNNSRLINREKHDGETRF